MTPDRLVELSRLPLFPRTAAELMRVAGTDAAAALIAAWPGQEFPVPLLGGRKSPLGMRRFDQLAEIVGEAAARAIVKHWGGLKLSIPNLKEVLWQWRQQQIRAEYDRLTAGGYSHPEAVFELGIAHGVTGRAVELVLKRPDLDATESAQGCLF